MKTLSIYVVAISFVVVSSLSQVAFGYNPTLEDQFGSATTTKLAHDGSILILNQTSEKWIYKSGDNITIIPKVINIGNKTANLYYPEPSFFLEIKSQDGNLVWPQSAIVAYIPEYGGMKALKPGEQYGVKPWTTPTGPAYDPSPIVLSVPGNYTAVSMLSFKFDPNSNDPHSNVYLWSKPVQITILSEKYMQNEASPSIGKIESLTEPNQFAQDSDIPHKIINGTGTLKVHNYMFTANIYSKTSGIFEVQIPRNFPYYDGENGPSDTETYVIIENGMQLTPSTYAKTISDCFFTYSIPFHLNSTITILSTDTLYLMTPIHGDKVPGYCMPETTIPEFPFSQIMLVFGIISAITIYRNGK
jgi:hypothetical protein